MRRRTFLHTRIFTEVLVWFPTGVLSYADTSIRQHVCTSMHQYVCMSVHQRSCVSVRPCGLAFSNVCFRPCSFIALLLHRFCPQRNIQIRRSVSFPPCVAAFGFVPVACGVVRPLSGAFLPRIFAPKRQGNVPDAHTAPRLRPSFGQLGGIGRPIPLGLVTGRSIPQSVVYGFLCPRRHSKVSFELLKGFPVTPGNDLAPCGGGLPLRSREACFLPAVCVPEAALVP